MSVELAVRRAQRGIHAPAGSTDEGVAVLTPPAWSAVFGAQGEEGGDLDQKRYVAIALATPTSPSSSVYAPRWHSLVLPAVCGPAPEPSAQNSESAGLDSDHDTPPPLAYVPRQVLSAIASPTAYVRPIVPISLSSVVLATPSATLLSESEEHIASFLNKRILCQGQTVSLPLRGSGPASFAPARVIMIDPVLQGVVTVDTQLTLTLVPPEARVEDEDEDDNQSSVADVSALPDGSSLLSAPAGDGESEENDDQEGMDRDDLLIDEHFLAQTLAKLEPSAEGAKLPAARAPSRRVTDTPTFLARILPSPHATHAVLSAWAPSGSDRSRADVDEEAVVLIPESQLSRAGCLSGQFALLSSKPDQPGAVERMPGQRLVRVFGAPAALLPSFPRTPNGVAVFLPPLLLANLFTSDSEHRDPHAEGENQVYITALPASLAPHGQPPIPFAEGLTLARVASPASVDKAQEPLFLAALRAYFANHRRIVLAGDLIAVALDGRVARWVNTGSGQPAASATGANAPAAPNGSAPGPAHPGGPTSVSARGSDTGGPSPAGGEDDDLDVASLSLPGGDKALTEVVYYRVVDVRPDLDPTPPTPTSSQPKLTPTVKAGTSDPLRTDAMALRSLAWNGSLGALVDPGLTQIVQAGLVHSRVPSVAGWLGLDAGLPPYPLPGSALTLPEAPLGQLQALLRAALHPAGAKAGVHVTALLEGARGSGKRTTTLWAAQSMGVHVVQIDCFALLADSNTRTEGTLRARLERAKQAAPAVILLRGIEALGSKAQATESGHEPAMTRVLADCLETLKVTPSQPKEAPVGRPSSPSPASASASNQDSSKTDEFHPLVVLASTSEAEKCPPGLLALFKHKVQWDAPNEQERLSILQGAIAAASTTSTAFAGAQASPDAVMGSIVLAPDVSLSSLATQTAALVAGDLADLVARAKAAATARIREQIPTGVPLRDVLGAGVSLTGSDFDAALASARATYSESIGAPKIPNVTWDDVGGLASVKHDILDTIQLPLERPDLFADGLKKRSGVLLYGPPGTGKTLLAKAVATSCSLNFFSVKGPELLNMYIGESEANVRRVFQKARDATPCVIFFDELDSVAPKRGNQGDSGGVMDRIVSQLLAELDGMASGGGDVFVIGATNRPDLLDPALLRPGRFDKLLYLSVAETHEAQKTILQALTRKFRLDPDVGDLTVIADQCPFNLTGADFYALASDAMLKAMTRKANEVDQKIAELNRQPGPHDWPTPLTAQYYLSELATRQDYEVSVSRQDFELALRELVPSVSEDEMAHYRSVRAKFEDPEKDKKGKEGMSNGHSESSAGPAQNGVHIDLSQGIQQDQFAALAEAAQNGDAAAMQALQGALAHPNSLLNSSSGHNLGTGQFAPPVEVSQSNGKAASGAPKKNKGKGKARAP